MSALASESPAVASVALVEPAASAAPLPMVDFGMVSEWSAVLLNLAGAWWVGSLNDREQRRGFAFLLAANAAWMAWSWHQGAWGLFTMQIAFIGLNIRGITNHLRPRRRAEQTTEPHHAE